MDPNMTRGIALSTLLVVVVMSGFGTSESIPLSKGAPATKKENVCRAAIATLMGRSPAIMSVGSGVGGVIYLYYIRPDDGAKRSYRCRIEGRQVLWGSASGRWRDHILEERIFYSATDSGITIIVTYGNGTRDIETFAASQF